MLKKGMTMKALKQFCMRQQAKGQKGFSLPEVIIITAVLAIITGMAFPDIAYFFQRQQVEQERTMQQDILKAMDAYAKECLRLPARTNNPDRDNCRENGGGTLTWGEALASFTNLSAPAMEKDVWGNDRNYTVVSEDKPYREGVLTFYSASVRSAGENQCDDKNAVCTDGSGKNVALSVRKASLGGMANSNDFNTTAQYGQLNAKGDDMLIKYTDNQVKTQRYEETVKRMERLIDALDRYAQGKFNDAVLTGTEQCISELIFYPPSSNGSGGGFDGWDHNNPGQSNPACRNLAQTDKYASNVRADLQNITGRQNVRGMDGSTDTRMTDMKGLMRVLGLPEDHCCSALTNEPFYYASSPQPRGPAGCLAHTGRPPYLPPKISITADQMCP